MCSILPYNGYRKYIIECMPQNFTTCGAQVLQTRKVHVHEESTLEPLVYSTKEQDVEIGREHHEEVWTNAAVVSLLTRDNRKGGPQWSTHAHEKDADENTPEQREERRENSGEERCRGEKHSVQLGTEVALT